MQIIQQIKSTPKTLYFKNATTQTGTDCSASKLVYFKKFGAEVPNVAKKVQADFYFVEEEISQIEINEDEISDYLKENYEIAQIQDINEDNEFRDFNNQDKDGKEDQFVKVVKEDKTVNQVTDQNQMKNEENVEEIETGLERSLPNKEQPKSNKSKEEVVEEIILEMKSSQQMLKDQPSEKEQPKTTKTLGITKEDTKRTVAKDTKPQKPKKQEERRELGMAQSKGGFGSCVPRTRQPATQPQIQQVARRQNRMLENEPRQQVQQQQQQQQQPQQQAFGANYDFMVPPPGAQPIPQNNMAQLQQQQFAVNAQQRLIAPVPQQNMVQMQFMSQQSQIPVPPPVEASKSLLASSSQFKARKQAPPQEESPQLMMKKKVATQAQSKEKKEVQHFQEQPKVQERFEENEEGYDQENIQDHFFAQEHEEQHFISDAAPMAYNLNDDYQIVPIENEEQQYFEPEQNENQNEIMKSPMQFADDFALLEPLFGLFDDNDVSVQTASFSVSSTQQQQQQQNQQANQQYGQVFNGQQANYGQQNQQCGYNQNSYQNNQQNSQFSNQFSNQNSQNNTSMSVSGKEKQSMYQIEQFGQQLLVFINEYFKSQFNGLKEALVYYKQYTRQNGTRVKLNFKKLGDMFNISADDSYNRFEQILQQNLDTWDTDQVKAVKAEVKRQFELTKGMSKKDRAFQIRKQVNTILALEDQVEKNYKQIANVINYQITVLEKSL
ncbi:Hypothetical_protein [Hexamita inflata]|uniref:Hypothetical_protein n=1 Tax=Hexamita inflata TaxID=28002 RepID=A0AA86N6W8_9EUKA|nr:Hypothetical protein HINF_LOCUS1674 [Hexamita inflata]